MLKKKDKVKLIAVIGPTATGKTKLAIDLALKLGTEIISADSMQIYKDMQVGTSQPTKEELKGVKYHLIGFRTPKEEFSVKEFVDLSKNIICDLDSRGKIPIICGGTGLYINSLIQNVDFLKTSKSSNVRNSLEEEMNIRGVDFLYERLKTLDPISCKKIHKNDKKRIIRALEIYSQTGITMSEQVEKSKNKNSFDVLKIGLNFRSRENLYGVINQRVDLMLENGLVLEAEKSYRVHYSKTAGAAICYKELFDHFDGQISLEKAVEILKQKTRNYAKRQITWFKKMPDIKWFYVDEEKSYQDLFLKVSDKTIHFTNDH